MVEKSKWFLSDVQYVLLAGGSVRNPIFVKFLQELLPSATVWRPQTPDTLVAVGAAIKSFYKYALGVELFHPICSDTLGVVTVNSGFYSTTCRKLRRISVFCKSTHKNII